MLPAGRHPAKRRRSGGGLRRADDERQSVRGTEREDGEGDGLLEQPEVRSVGSDDEDEIDGEMGGDGD